MRLYEIKNNMYHGLPILKQDGTQINLGCRTDKKNRKVLLREDEINKEQIKNLSMLNILSVKTV